MVLSLKTWKSRSLPVLPRANNPHHDEQFKKPPPRETGGGFFCCERPALCNLTGQCRHAAITSITCFQTKGRLAKNPSKSNTLAGRPQAEISAIARVALSPDAAFRFICCENGTRSPVITV